ncbi:acyltransferase [Kosakonia quasisacchari]|uniref:Acyltransferase n=1 Tax=Kosakonia quasisacchari TaxID=2529380 RepID=A0A4R0H703_9ENTR|nr:acyltransferase [Kosakonia quasisacchari]TCC06547.1 acyltransferase [Kosakonia quasisacchari]
MRIATIDLLKILAIFLVILAHVTLFFLNHDESDVVLCFFRQAGLCGVALFFICSGYFLLNNKHEDQANYVIAKIKSIVGVLIFWLLFYYAYDTWWISRFTDVPEINLLNYLNVSKATTEATPLWFIFAIIPLYIFTPLMRHAFKKERASEILKVVVLMVVIANLTLLNTWTEASFNFSLFAFNLLIPFQPEGLICFLIGGYLGLVKPTLKQFSIAHIMTLTLAVIALFVLAYISSSAGIAIFYGKFYNILLLISSVGLFLFIVNLNINMLPRWVSNLSDNVLGIYLVHNIFVVEIHSVFIHEKLLGIISEANIYLYIIAYSLLAFVLSYGLCALLKRSKITARIVTL